MLTEFFYVNKTNTDAQRIKCTYSKFPNHFVWKPSQRYWKLREREDSIGRIMTTHSSEGERYYLRLLLSKVRCPTSFEDLRTYNGAIVSTFREATLIRGLLQDDNSQDLCLEEASHFKMPSEMRRLFATILVHCCPNNPKQLWQKFKIPMLDDLLRPHTRTFQQIEQQALQQIDGFLRSMGKSIHSFDLISPDTSYTNIEDQTREVRAEKSITITPTDLTTIHLLNEKQSIAFKAITHRIYSGNSGAFFIDSPGGTGKTFQYKALLADIRSKGYIALATATSGIAASILPGGRTAHSQFKIPIDISEGTICRISKQTCLALMIREAKLIIWDEAPMAKRAAIKTIDNLLKDLMDSIQTFGGKAVVLGGDFRQTLPVVPKGTKAEMINVCLINSPIYHKLENFRLTDNMRARLDPSFTDFLLKVGDGTIQIDSNDLVTIPSSIVLPYSNQNEANALQTLIDIIYPEISNPLQMSLLSLNRAILTTKNPFVDEINNALIDRYPGEVIEYLSYDETFNEIHYTECIQT